MVEMQAAYLCVCITWTPVMLQLYTASAADRLYNPMVRQMETDALAQAARAATPP
jgi:hypothetical protein